MIITIDGPVGTGKSTVAKKVAGVLNMNHLDSGAIYRAMAWFYLKKNIELNNEQEMKNALALFRFSIKKGHFYVDGEEITNAIRTEEISALSSKISKFSWVRKALLPIQNQVASQGDLIAEGRDMGTVVFPEAQLKIFLTAVPAIRAQRRYKELKEKSNVTYDQVLKELEHRDHEDTTRSISPLKPADCAVIIDTSHMSIDEVVEEILQHYRDIES